MVKRQCPKCDAIFNQKCHYEAHMNKKFDCSGKKNNTNESMILCQSVPRRADSVPGRANFGTTNNQNNTLVVTDIQKNNLANLAKPDPDSELNCDYCKKKFSSKSTLTRHLKINCNVKKREDKEKNDTLKLVLEKEKQHIEEIDELKKQNKLLIDKMNNFFIQNNEIIKIHKTIKKLETAIPANTNLSISNQLVEQIIQKDKKIEELVKTYNNKIVIEDDIDVIDENKPIQIDKLEEKPMTLILNNNIIECRKSDGYINATQLCKAGGKKFGHWYRIDSTKQLILELAKKINNKDNTLDESFIASNIQIWILNLVDAKVGGEHNSTWLHPDLAIQLAQWISPSFALQVSHWVRTLFTKGKVEVDIKILKEKENTIKDYKKRIDYLEKATLKRHSRKNIENKFNVVYLIICDELEANRKYIIGKAKDLLNRLSQYDKVSNFRVVYYKSFKDEDDMEFAESIVLHSLEKYKEQMNHDRFILPADKDINYFKNAFDNASKCFNY